MQLGWDCTSATCAIAGGSLPYPAVASLCRICTKGPYRFAFLAGDCLYTGSEHYNKVSGKELIINNNYRQQQIHFW